MPLQLPRFDRTVPLVDEEGLPTQTFHQWWQAVAKALEDAVARIDSSVADLAAIVASIVAAQAAADAAQASADAATADAAAAAADAAAAAADALANAREAARINSYTAPTIVLTGVDTGAGHAKVTVANHDRIYPIQGTVVVPTVSITGIPDFTGLLNSTLYYVYYDDTTLALTTPTMHITTVPEDAQVGAAAGRHFVGTVTTPAAAAPPSTGGGGARPPGGGGGDIP
jgi:membrane protein involved in colicin uptake